MHNVDKKWEAYVLYNNRTDEVEQILNGILIHVDLLFDWGKSGDNSLFHIQLKDHRKVVTEELALEIIRDYEVAKDNCYFKHINIIAHGE